MESRISKKLRILKEKKEKALITYVTSGDPDLDITVNLFFKMEEAGADIIELGIPYSDPLADGPIIQRASQRALKEGTNIDSVFNVVLKIRKKSQTPIAVLVYFNSIYKYGIDKFLNNCRKCGIDGLIIPDLPVEERKELSGLMKDYPIDLIPIVAPTSEDRIKEIVSNAQGFVYCISSTGVTGMRESFEDNLSEFMDKFRKYTDTPLAIGFGIGDEKAIKNLKDLSDGLIVGSAIIKKVEEGIEAGGIEERVFLFVKKLHEALS